MQKTVTTLLCFLGFGAVAFFLADHNLNGVKRLFYAPRSAADPPPPLLLLPGATPAAAVEPDKEPPLPPRPSLVDEGSFKGRPLDDPTNAMVPLYQALAAKKGTVRVLWFGDSIIADDNLSSRLRHALQQAFGDGGPGFVYGGAPSRWYELRDATHEVNGFQPKTIVNGGIADRLYGLGGATFEAAAAGKTATFGAAKVSRFEVAYLAQPDGSPMELLVDGQLAQTIDTGATAPESRWAVVDVPDGPHTLTVRAGGPKVRLFGVELTRADGVVVDGLGLASSSAGALSTIEPAHWKGQLQHAQPALVLVFLGANEADADGWASNAASARYEQDFEKLLGTLREDVPGAACLVMSPLDSSVEKDGKLVTKPALPYLVAAQKKAAAAKGCAFWNSFDWMGGKGSMATWFARHLVSPDYMHPTRAGAAKVGDALFAAIVHGYDQWAKAQP